MNENAKSGATFALIYDFDKTLCTKNMQEYTFIPNVGMDPDEFWKVTGEISAANGMDPILSYMYVMLDRAKAVHAGIRRSDFTGAGRGLDLFPGVEEWFSRINAYGRELGFNVEHYIISSGLREIIDGSPICSNFREIFACEYYYDENGVAVWPRNVVNYTTKTQFLFRINKGALDMSDNTAINKYVPEDERPVPFRYMMYFGDGESDIPCMRLVKSGGGSSVAVYSESSKTADQLLSDGRVNFTAPADYREGTRLDEIVKAVLRKASFEL